MNDVERIEKDAAYWIEQINRPAIDTSQSARFDAWMTADARHAEAFARLQALWDAPAFDTALRDLDLDDEDERETAVPLASASVPRPRGRHWFWMVGTGMAAASVAAILLLWSAGGQVQQIETPRGAVATVVLADGSRVELGPNSKVEATYRPFSRTVTLARGEAYFDVRPDNWRPFRVASGANQVEVLGTAFNVDRQSETSTVVEVFRGRVAMGPRGGKLVGIGKGRRGRIDGGQLTLARLDQDQGEPGWKSGWFDASAVPLRILIDKLNRYSDKPVVVARPGLTARIITGRFRVREVESTLRALAAAYDLRLEETDSTITLK